MVVCGFSSCTFVFLRGCVFFNSIPVAKVFSCFKTLGRTVGGESTKRRVYRDPDRNRSVPFRYLPSYCPFSSLPTNAYRGVFSYVCGQDHI